MSEPPKTPEEEPGGAESPRNSNAVPVRSTDAAWPGAVWSNPSDPVTIRFAGDSLAALRMGPDPSSMFSTETLRLSETLTGRLELRAVAPLTSAIEEAGRVSASLRGVLDRSGLAQSPFTPLDAGLLPDRLSTLITGLGSTSLPGTRLGEFAALGRFDLGSALAPLATAPFSDAIRVTGLADLGASYDRVLGSISTSTSALFQQTLQVPDLSAFVQHEVVALGQAFTTAAGSLAFDPAGTLRVTPDWTSPTLFPTVTGLMTKPTYSEDVAGILSGFDRLASWPAGRSVVESVLGSPYAGTMGAELQAELPAVIRRAVAAPPVLDAGVATPSGDTRFVQLAVAWIQAWSARRGIVLSAGETLMLVVTIAIPLAAMVTSGVLDVVAISSSTADAERVIEAQGQAAREIVGATDRQTEAIERLSIPPPTEATHLVTEHVQVRATPSPDATGVGHAYPNQWVIKEGDEAGWSRITFEDRIASQTRAGWVPSEALRESVVSFEPPGDAEPDTPVR